MSLPEPMGCLSFRGDGLTRAGLSRAELLAVVRDWYEKHPSARPGGAAVLLREARTGGQPPPRPA